MTTQERLTNYQQQLEQMKTQERMLVGELTEREETLQTVRNRMAALTGACQALQEEMQSQKAL